jgi:Zn-dependent protease with chaperone function
MMQIKGIFFDGHTARAHDAVLHADKSSIRITDAAGRLLAEPDNLMAAMKVVPKLGKTRRVIRFDKGRQFETADFGAVETLEKQLGVNRTFRLVDLLEDRWQAVLICLAGLVAVVYVSVAWGLPRFARVIAFKLPPNAMDAVSQDAMAMFDKRFFKPSDLPENEKAKIREAFLQLIREAGGQYSFSLQFRKAGEAVGANAFALPSGIIIVTDDLVTTAADIREIQGVLVHEIAHVTQRHAVRSVIQNTGVVVLISLLAGDVSSITSLAAGIPTLLLESGYSRAFEIEADRAVGRYFVRKGWPLKPYEDILIRIVKPADSSGYPSFLSTHPDLKKRIERLQQFSHTQKQAILSE